MYCSCFPQPFQEVVFELSSGTPNMVYSVPGAFHNDSVYPLKPELTIVMRRDIVRAADCAFFSCVSLFWSACSELEEVCEP